ncbi:MAG: hypothetical protein QM323_08090, partial [Acidobacteriota bacterium]|nr:hypothetical protein [Acidobacteriota bacterium]
DAHIVETDSAGRSALVGLTLVDAVDEVVLDITGANTLVPAVQVTSDATCYQAVPGAAGIGFSVTLGAASTGVGFTATMTGAAAGANGVSVSADNATAGPGISSSHAGSGSAGILTATGLGYALDVIGSALATFGARFVGGGTASLYAEGVGAAFGAIIQSSATAAADALGLNTLNNTGTALVISTPGGSTSAARGIFASVSGSAIAAEFVSAANYAAIFTGDTTSPTFPALFVTGQNARAGSWSNGGLMYLSSEAQFAAACEADGTWRGLWTSESGYAYGGDVVAPSTFNGVSGSWATAITFSANGGDAPKTLLGGDKIRVRINVGAASLNAGVDIVLGLRIRDMTAGGTPVIWTRSGAGSGDASGWKIVGYAAQAYGPPVSTVVELTVPSTGDRAWRLEYSFSGGAGGVKIRDVSVEFLGLVS